MHSTAARLPVRIFVALALLSLLLAASSARALETGEIDALIQSMSLEELTGQVFMIHFPGSAYTGEVAQFVEQDKVGGVILYSVTGNISGPAGLADLTEAMQAGARSQGLPGLLISVDQEGGPVARLRQGFTEFPSQMCLGATAEPELARTMARDMARELAWVGVNVDFAPVVDVNVNPDNPIIGIRSFGSDPDQVAAFGAAAVQGFLDGGVACAAKHFPGHGDTAMDSHLGLPVVTASRQRLEQVELVPFRAAIAAGTPMVMTAHVAVPALEPQPRLPATMSSAVLQGVLRRELGFTGVIVSDSMFMGAILDDKDPGLAAARAFLAGADLLLFGADFYTRGKGPEGLTLQRTALESFREMVRSGRIPMARVRESARRILELKARLGLLGSETPAPAPEPDLAAHGADALAMARAGVTLLRPGKGQHPMVPLDPDETVALVVPEPCLDLARELMLLRGGVEVVAVQEDPTPAEIAKSLAAARRAGRVVLVVDDVRRHPLQASLADALKRLSLAIVLAKSPYDAARLPRTCCLVASYGSTPVQLRAAAELLAGTIQAHGTLPVKLPEGSL